MGVSAVLAAGAVASVATGGLALQQQKKALNKQKKAAERQTALEIAELDRQIGEVEEDADQDVSDRMRAANRDIAAFRGGFAFGGGSGSTNELRGVIDIGFAEGEDIARVRENARRDRGALEAGQDAARTRLADTKDSIKQQKKAATFQFIGNSLSAITGAGKGIAKASAANTPAGAQQSGGIATQ